MLEAVLDSGRGREGGGSKEDEWIPYIITAHLTPPSSWKPRRTQAAQQRREKKEEREGTHYPLLPPSRSLPLFQPLNCASQPSHPSPPSTMGFFFHSTYCSPPSFSHSTPHDFPLLLLLLDRSRYNHLHSRESLITLSDGDGS